MEQDKTDVHHHCPLPPQRQDAVTPRLALCGASEDLPKHAGSALGLAGGSAGLLTALKAERGCERSWLLAQ